MTDASLPLTPLGPDRTVEQVVVRELRASIVEGRLGPGIRLPLRNLARQLSVSVTPIRIALRVLVQEGLVEAHPSGGMRVASLSLEELEDVYASRSGFESWLARRGAPLLTDAQLAVMERCFAQVEQTASAGDRIGFATAALGYRVHCYRAADRQRMLQATLVLVERSKRYNHLTLPSDARLAAGLGFARDFRSACRDRDGLRARSIVRALLDASLDSLLAELTTASQAPAPARDRDSAGCQ